ncbi:hypothetical protein A1O3_08989 [Capronia epimyces CBS 606.96]|uniref:Alcohol acetyltransferase n=1 Tax=Capronia epimyces CBS 606.96 TaxID=1182542 RepID=W9XKI2_9EURO|nr:uncharacterized protein A1O3_08989 [Capronia epimyces CBS 606.96]EXJ77830.1 hypothetical protein A1O3_08989 [Capronia epimyces CBS 606.96]
MWLIGSKTPKGDGYLRATSPNERRCVARESLGFYHALIVGGIYQFSEPVELASISTYVHALRQCVRHHPQLCCTVAEPGTQSPYYKACACLDLSRHVQILPQRDGRHGVQSVEEALPVMLDSMGPPHIPAWKITVIPFSQQRCFLGFSFSHSLGDGMSGIAFHRTFLDALQETGVERELIWTPNLQQLDPPFDTSTNLPISWSFLLRPLLGVILPKRVASLLGFGITAPAGIWTASKMFYNPEKHQTCVKVLSIDAATVKEALKVCRAHQGKLTGLLHQLIINSLSEAFAHRDDLDHLAARTALNMRGPVGKSNDEMGNFITAVTQFHAIKKLAGSDIVQEVDWESVQAVTERLAAAAKELRDQPLGLLRYLSDVRSWVSSQLGEPRDCSYEVSNLVSFQPARPTSRCAVTEMIFCQPADVLGAPLNFNVVSVANGPLSIAVSWQAGALALASEEDEDDFVERICQGIRSGFGQLVSRAPG